MNTLPPDLVYIRYEAEGFDGMGRKTILMSGIWLERPPRSKNDQAVLNWIRADANSKLFRVDRVILK